MPLRPHQIRIYNKQPGTISTGLNTMVTLDGQPFHGITKIEFVAEHNALTRVKIELLADVEVEADIETIELVKKEQNSGK